MLIVMQQYERRYTGRENGHRLAPYSGLQSTNLLWVIMTMTVLPTVCPIKHLPQFSRN